MSALTPVEKWSYAIGNIPFSVKDATFVNFVVFYYTQVQGLSGSLAGLAMFIALTWDAITDPIVGSWSDTFRSRWGRRHPLLVIGGIPTTLLFLVLFPPDLGLGQTGLFLWLLISSMLLRTFLTIYYIPYSAMGAELSTDYDERTVIAKARVTMGWFAGMLIAAGAFAFIFQPEGDADGRLIADNYITYGIIAAVLSGVTALICLYGTRTVIPRLPTASPTQQTFGLGTIFNDLRTALQNYNFRITVIANLAFGMAAGVYTTINLYMGTYFWEFSSDQLAALVVPTFIATLVSFAALNRLGRSFDKPQLMCAAALCLALNSAWMIGARLLDLLPDNSHESIYLLQVLNTFIAVFVIVSLQVLGVSLTADVLDEQELETGKRQEGVFFAASNFIGKATTGFGALIAGMIVEISGIAPGSEPGTVAESVLNIMGGLTMAIIFILTFSAFLVFRLIRLSREDHTRIRAELTGSMTPADGTEQ